jgi:DNA topoisomerase-1
LGFNARRTMKVAQELYEGRQLGKEGSVGLITYMRTDSTNVSKDAQEETRAYVRRRFGGDFVPSSPRVYTKKAKGAQEAHEAIRPTSVQREPEAIRRHLTPDQLKLYTLIWQRMVASQMADAVFDQTSVDITATPQSGGDAYLFRATASRLRFPGFRAVYFESRDDGVDEDADTNALPDLTAGDALLLHELFPDQHFTEPPPRYTEASLVKALEENGIGRPSTYAPILATLENREYVERNGRQLRPQELGFVVTDMLTEHFPNFVDIGFTAEMEEELDDIAQGSREWQPVVDQYYQPLDAAVKAAAKATVVFEESDEDCPECGAKMVVRWGRFGKFLACSRYPECKGSKPLEGDREEQIVSDEFCPECNSTMTVKQGRFGRFLACSRYPECKGSRPFLNKIGVPCPKDDGQIVERKMKGRGKRVFYGCSNYPNCDFTSWTKPTGARCPACDYLVVPEGQRGLRCLQCGWRDSDALPEPAEPEVEKIPA